MADRVLELPICWKYVLPKEGGGSYEPMPHFPLSLSLTISKRERFLFGNVTTLVSVGREGVRGVCVSVSACILKVF